MYNRRKYLSSKDSQHTSGRNSSKSINKVDDPQSFEITKTDSIPRIKQPTILIKTRELVEDVSNLPKRTGTLKETESTSSVTAGHEASTTPTYKPMVESIKFLNEGTLSTESIQDYLQENNDFLVVGIVGAQGVGKSTILNLLAHKLVTTKVTDAIFVNSKNEKLKVMNRTLSNLKLKEDDMNNIIFPIESRDDIENNRNCTNGIDLYVTSNRIIFLDCQPFTSMSIIDDLVDNENKRSSLVSEFIPSENSGEIQALQLTAFLMTVCHVLLVVQDWFFDSNIIRFIQTAEMLKPTVVNPEDDTTDHFPHLLLIHNKARVEDFTPIRFKLIQQTYKSLFHKTKLDIESSIGIGTGRIIKHLNAENCGDSLNIYLIPEYENDDLMPFTGHPSLGDIIKRLRASIFGTTKHALTHVQLSEKTWLLYCSKAWDNVKKSSFFVEYTKLMP